MGVMQRVVRPKTGRSKRALEAREPKAVENTKTALVIRGKKSSDSVLSFLKDIYALKKPFVTEFHGRKNDILPFEDVTPLENLCKKNDASLFLFGKADILFIELDTVRQGKLKCKNNLSMVFKGAMRTPSMRAAK